MTTSKQTPSAEKVCFSTPNGTCGFLCAEAQVVRCFNCHDTNHTTRRCRGTRRCGWCSFTQHTDSRETADVKLAVPHAAATTRARTRLGARGARGGRKPPRSPGTYSRSTKFLEAPKSTDAPLGDAQEFTVVTSKRTQEKKAPPPTPAPASTATTRRRGRPTALSAAAEGSRPIDEMLQSALQTETADTDSITSHLMNRTIILFWNLQGYKNDEEAQAAAELLRGA